MIVGLLVGLAKANLAMGAAVLAVLALRGQVRPRFGARAAYALWLAPPAAALAAAIPHHGAGGAVAPVVLTLAAAGRALPGQAASHAGLVPMVLLAVWLVGAVAAATVLLRRQAAFLRSLGRLKPAGGGVLRAERTGVGPAVVGALHPRIVTPADFEARFGAAERELVLAHERMHLETGDAAVNALAAACQCLGWFNPLVHLGASRLRTDQELACDAAVVGRFPERRRLYAELLLKTQLGAQPLPFGCQWPADAQHPLKERIVMLKSPLPEPAMRAMGAFVAAAIVVAAGSAAWAATPAPAKLITQPVWVKKPDGRDIARLYPARAAQEKVTAQLTMACRIDAEGLLRDCIVDSGKLVGDALTRPDDEQAFKAAMLELSKSFQMAAVSRDGVKVAGASVRIPVRWMTPPGR